MLHSRGSPGFSTKLAFLWTQQGRDGVVELWRSWARNGFCHRSRHAEQEQAEDAAQERVTKGPRQQKALFMLNLTHTLCPLSQVST